MADDGISRSGSKASPSQLGVRTFLEHLGPVYLDQTEVCVFVFLAVAHVGRGYGGQWERRRLKKRWLWIGLSGESGLPRVEDSQPRQLSIPTGGPTNPPPVRPITRLKSIPQLASTAPVRYSLSPGPGTMAA